MDKQSLVSVVIPVMQEIESLNETVRIIIEDSPDKRFEFIIVTSPSSSLDCVKNIDILANSTRYELTNVVQKIPGIGGAYRHGFELVTGERIIMIAADLETDPRLVRRMIELSDASPNKIVTTTRWKGEGSGFIDYGRLKLLLNRIFQRWISSMFKSDLTDYTFGFRLYPTIALANIEWENRDFAFLLESILKPIKMGWKAVEIPHLWRPREEGESNNRMRYFLAYFKIAIKIRYEK